MFKKNQLVEQALIQEDLLLPKLFGVETLSQQDIKYTALNVVPDPHGGIRWLFPKENRTKLFLSLYNPGKIRGIMLKKLMGLGISIPLLGSSFFQNKDVPSYFLTQLQELLKSLHQSDWALFTGTPGLLRKGVFALGKEGRPNYFLKVPTSVESKRRLENELSFCQMLKRELPRNVQIPEAWRSPSTDGILFSNIRPGKFRRIKSLPKSGFDFLAWMNGMEVNLSSTINEHFFDSLLELRQGIDVHRFSLNFDHEKISACLGHWDYLLDILKGFGPLAFAIGHGDFTPWNMFQEGGKLYVYDWELAGYYPAWYDLFHFHYQKGILLDRKPFHQISRQIDDYQSMSFINQWLHRKAVNWDTYHLAYLLKMGIEYLNRYTSEEKHVVQTHWIIEFLCDAYQNFVETWKEL